MGGGKITRPGFGLGQPDPGHPMTEFYTLLLEALSGAESFALPGLYARFDPPAWPIEPEEAKDWAALSPAPEEGWLAFTYDFARKTMFPEEDFEPRRRRHGAGAVFFLVLLQVLLHPVYHDDCLDVITHFEEFLLRVSDRFAEKSGVDPDSSYLAVISMESIVHAYTIMHDEKLFDVQIERLKRFWQRSISGETTCMTLEKVSGLRER